MLTPRPASVPLRWKTESRRLAILLLILITAVTASAQGLSQEAGKLEVVDWTAAEQSRGKPRKYYLDRRIAPTMSYAGGASWLVRPEREAEESAAEMLAALKLQPGMTVADFGCGVGYHSLPIAQAVAPDGEVYAIDLQIKMLRSLVARASEAGIFNIRPVVTRSDVPDLPAAKFDMVLMVDVYHELSFPAETLQEIRQSLKPDGRIALVEYRGEDPDVPILPEHKMTKSQILREFTANGFQLESTYDSLPWQHVMFFTADAPAKEPEA